jgi:hypothetical protein
MRYPPCVRSLAPLALLAAAGFSSLAGCVNTDANVFVAPTITSPTAALTTSNPLGFGLQGSFDLGLDLSPRASGPSTVNLGQVNLLDATMMPILDVTTKMPVAQALSATASPAFPTTVQPGSDPTVMVTFDTGTMLLPKCDGKALCAAAGLVVEVEIQDSLLAGMSKAAYAPIPDVGGCAGLDTSGCP